MTENFIEKYDGKYFSLLNDYDVPVENFEEHLMTQGKGEQTLFSEAEMRDLIIAVDTIKTEF